MSYNRRKTLAQLVTEVTGNDPQSQALCGKSLRSMIEEIADCVEFTGKTVSFSEKESMPGVLMVDPLNFEGKKHFNIELIKSNGYGGFWMHLTPDEDDYKRGDILMNKMVQTFVSPGIFTVDDEEILRLQHGYDTMVEKDPSIVPMSGPTGLLAYCDVSIDRTASGDSITGWTVNTRTRKIAPDFKERVGDILQSFMFEFNDDQTRKTLEATLEKFFCMQYDLGYAKPQITVSSVSDDQGISIGLLFPELRKYYDFFLSNDKINVSENSAKETCLAGDWCGPDGPSGPAGICSDNHTITVADANCYTTNTAAANWIVCGEAITTALQNTAQFINTYTTNTVVSNSSLTSIGTVSGFQVYADPNTPADTILIGHKEPHQKEDIIKQMIDDFNKLKK